MDFGVLSNNLGSAILGESLSGVSFVSSVGEKIGEIHLSAGVYLVFSAITLNKDRVSPGTIADIVINASHGASASLCRGSEENISTVKWDTKTLVGLHTGNSATVVGVHATIYGGDLGVDAIQCKGIYAVRLR